MHAFLSLTNGQWHKCMHSCHWPVVNDINACIYVIDQWSMTKWMNLCHWPVVVFVYKRLQFHLGLTPKSAFLSLTSGQWHECTIECDLHSANCIFVNDQIPKRTHQDRLTPYSVVMHAFVSLTSCSGQWHLECPPPGSLRRNYTWRDHSVWIFP